MLTMDTQLWDMDVLLHSSSRKPVVLSRFPPPPLSMRSGRQERGVISSFKHCT